MIKIDRIHDGYLVTISPNAAIDASGWANDVGRHFCKDAEEAVKKIADFMRGTEFIIRKPT